MGALETLAAACDSGFREIDKGDASVLLDRKNSFSFLPCRVPYEILAYGRALPQVVTKRVVRKAHLDLFLSLWKKNEGFSSLFEEVVVVFGDIRLADPSS